MQIVVVIYIVIHYITAFCFSGGRYLYRHLVKQLKEFQEKEAADCLEQTRYRYID